MARTTNSDTLPLVESRYELGMLASQRVRDLNGGAEPIIDKNHDKPTVLSLREMASGKLSMDKLRHEFIQSYKENSSSSEKEDSLEISSEDPLLRELDAELLNELVQDQPIINETEELVEVETTEESAE